MQSILNNRREEWVWVSTKQRHLLFLEVPNIVFIFALVCCLCINMYIALVDFVIGCKNNSFSPKQKNSKVLKQIKLIVPKCLIVRQLKPWLYREK